MRAEAAGLEVFLVRRHDNVAFMGGAHVFPGGRVDAADHLDEPGRWCDGGIDARMRGRTPGEALAFQVAAARELFEEAGILLARPDLDPPKAGVYRRRLLAGELTLLDILARERARLALDALALFAHWVTPIVETRRFDTYFFLAIAPESQHAAHCDRETSDGVWIRPADALARCLSGDIALPPPTWTTLRALTRVATVDEAWRWAKAHTVPRVQPCFEERADGTRLVMLPGDPRCPATETFEATETRFILERGRWTPVH